MTERDLNIYFSNAVARIPVTCQLAHRYPGYVRVVYIAQDFQIVVEFDQYGFDEGGAYFYGQYGSFNDVLGAASEYLKQSLQDVPLGSPLIYPDRPVPFSINESAALLQSDIQNGTVELPSGARFALRGTDYWSNRAHEKYQES